MTTKKIPTSKATKSVPKLEPLDYLKKKFVELCEEYDLDQESLENNYYGDDGTDIYFITEMLKDVYGLEAEFVNKIDFVKV